jgi:hypothetical protein
MTFFNTVDRKPGICPKLIHIHPQNPVQKIFSFSVSACDCYRSAAVARIKAFREKITAACA